MGGYFLSHTPPVGIFCLSSEKEWYPVHLYTYIPAFKIDLSFCANANKRKVANTEVIAWQYVKYIKKQRPKHLNLIMQETSQDH